MFQTTLGLLLVQALDKQVGGLEEPEVVSPKASIVVGVYDCGTFIGGKVGVIILAERHGSAGAGTVPVRVMLI